MRVQNAFGDVASNDFQALNGVGCGGCGGGSGGGCGAFVSNLLIFFCIVNIVTHIACL
jgi:hypothetical protein